MLEVTCHFRRINEVCCWCLTIFSDGNAFCFLLYFFFLLLTFKSFEEQDLMIMRAIDQRLGTKSDWIREILKRFL